MAIQTSARPASAKVPAALYMSSAATTNPPPVNALLSGPDMEAKAGEVWATVQSGVGRVQLGDDPDKLAKINEFLTTYPARKKSMNKSQVNASNTPWVDISARELFRQTIQTAIDIINDVSALISDKPFISSTDFRRGIFDAFAQPARRTYVGLWLVFFSFLLYFIDSAT